MFEGLFYCFGSVTGVRDNSVLQLDCDVVDAAASVVSEVFL